MNLDWTAIASISEVVAAIAVVVSLWYVAAQLRQNTSAIIASSRHGMLDADLQLISLFMTHGVDPHLIDDKVKLSPVDERRITWMVVMALRIREFAWNQYRDGKLDDATWQSYMEPVAGIFSTARARSALDFYVGDPDFKSEIHRHLAASAAAPDAP